MDKRRTINGIVLTLIAVGAWLLLQWYLPPVPPPKAATPPVPPPPAAPAVSPATGPAATSPSATGPSATGPSTTGPAIVMPPRVPDAPGAMLVDPAKAMPAALGNPAQQAADYAMQLRVNPRGAGLDGITLNAFHRSEDFKLPPKDRRVYEFQAPYAGAQYDYTRPGATRSVTLNGVTIDLSNALWEQQGPPADVTKQVNVSGGTAPVALNGQAVTYAVVVGLPDAQGVRQPVLKLSKTYTVFQRANVTQGFEVWIDQAYENVSDAYPTLAVSSLINGPTLPPRETNSSPDRSVFAGFVSGNGKAITVEQVLQGDFKDATPSINLQEKAPEADKAGKPTMTWAGTAGLYFNAFVQPVDPKAVVGVSAEQKEMLELKSAPEDRPVVMTIQTAPVTLGPKGSAPATVDLRAYFGPRWRHVLDTPFFAALPRGYDHTLVIKSGPCGWCAFDWLINGMVWLLNVLHWVAGGFMGKGDWGIAIILLVAIVRSLLHPITKRSQVQMMKMGKMGPELQKLKAKYGDDKEGYAKAQMEVMKSQGFAPVLGCLPIFLQMPIWIALWQALQSTFELRQTPFLWGYTWIQDLSKPDYLIKFDSSFSLWFIHLDGLNLLPLLLGVVFHLQARIQNSLSVAATPEQETQKKMMLWMSTFLFPLFLYNSPSGLNLYILTSTLVGMIESKIVRDHIKEREEAEKLAGPVVVVDAVPAKAGGGKKVNVRRADAPAEEPAKATGLRGMIARMQARVEELQREQEKKKKK